MQLKKIPENILVVIRAIVPLIIIIVLFTLLSQLGLSKIAQIRMQVADARQDQSVLTEKLEMLRSISVTGVEDSNVAVNGLPDTSPSLVAMSQLKTLAASNGVVLRALKSTASPDTTDINSVGIDFSVLGGKTNIESFLASINTFAPISTLDTVKLSQSGDSFLGSVTVKTYWAPLPTKLPSTIEEFQDLTPEDKNTLSALSQLTQPTFLNLPPATTGGRDDPFAQ